MLRTTGETRRGFTAVQAHTNAMPSRAVVEARKPAGLIASCGSGGRYDTLVASMAIVPLGWSSDRLWWRGSREHVPSVPVAAMAGKRLSIETPKCSGCFPHAHQIFEIVCRRKAVQAVALLHTSTRGQLLKELDCDAEPCLRE